MNNRQNQFDADTVFRAMREMLLEAPATDVDALANEAGMDARSLSEAGRSAIATAIAQNEQNRARKESVVPLHKGLHSLLVMLCRRDNLDESELAAKANVEESEIKRIEFDPGYLPSPRTIFNLERAFSLPAGVLAKLSGAVLHHTPVIEERALEFAANAKSMGRLTREELQLLNAFVSFLSEQQ